MHQHPALYALVLAGGSGTRLWPLSQPHSPKQLLALTDPERSMLRLTVDRLAPLVPPERVIVLTAADHVAQVRAQLPEVPARQVLGEPAPLGTAAALGLGVAWLRAQDPEAVMVVLSADHQIAPAEALQADLGQAAALARSGWLATIGIPPTAPETGFGYIELGEPIAAAEGGDGQSRRVLRFVEKPDPARAVAFLAGGRHLWNAGIFAWTVPVIGAAFAVHLPRLAAQLDALTTAAAAGDAAFAAALPAVWRTIEDRTTIDYGIMEQAERVACVPASFEWLDIGSWAAVMDTLPADEAGNAVLGRYLGLDSVDNLIFAPGGRLVATIGLQGMIVVDTPEALLICPVDRAQEVKRLVDALRSGDGGG
ncbi:MAG: mannose-1-phosphate guanylyltransferase [Anaerolineae bacterium]